MAYTMRWMLKTTPALVGALLALAVVGALAAPAAAAFLSTGQEIRIGREAAAQLEAEVGVVRDPVRTAQIAAIGARLAAASGRPELPWTFKILNTNQINAISLPGGFIYVTRGMLGFVRSEDELAFVLGHEVGHVDRRHHVAIIERDFFFGLVLSLLFGGDPTSGQIAALLHTLLRRGFSREAEFEADETGVLLTHRAGFNAGAGLVFMERLRAAEGRDPSQLEVLLSTHPALADRLARVREQLRRLGYRVGILRAAA
ncbi:MAG: M48 family metalloprotease [Armatimonadota bacterium]|nr:M48 family metalloprotease [Armatimonadota bacterium]MDR7452017.1 M48 family metalloprotease [Armatimonadota bacterium]MDR7467908.1 M48 family metalloprotease [Armatimonadota bacterium]MDR7494239.1 M48 family metalloprotease [Armatimonadota bacterium]MDR7500020.1 M48 family metalloprotease [Armatimonadota bacterium]